MKLFYKRSIFTISLLISFVGHAYAQSAPEIEGNAGLEVLPIGWETATPNNPANSPNTPDMVETTGSYYYPQPPYSLTDLNGGASPAGGNAALLLKNPVSNGNLNPEGIATTIIGLVSGVQYKIIVYWQQVQIVPPPDYPWYPSYPGGSLRATIDANTPQIFNSTSSYSDGWQTAEIVFTAAQSTARIALEVTGLNNALDQRNVIVVDYKDNIISLPVNFGRIDAVLKNNILSVQWSTLAETNSKHFEVELSADGKVFTKIGTVKSNALTASSSSPLNYTFSKDISDVTITFAGLAILSLFGISISRRRKLWFLFVFIAMGSIIVSCKKNDNVQLSANKNYFVRIKQVDIDNKESYSKVLKVVKQD